MKLTTTPLLTDLYQFTMMQAYLDEGMHAPAVFEFFTRKLPKQRNFLLAVGLEQVLQYLESLRFDETELTYLSQLGLKAALLDYLRGFHFGGDVFAMPEGTPFFPDEPIVQVIAPIAQAQLIETRLINLLHFESLIASKAVRCALVAPDKLLVDFGARRAHGAEAALLAAHASYVAGFSGTATVVAGAEFGMPVFGTMAHSYVQAHVTEAAAFENFAASLPENVTLLIDTYDTEAAAVKVVELAAKLRARGAQLRAVRLDSGDLAEHARQVRRILDQGGLTEVKIFCSGNIDEYRIQQLRDAGAPIDGYGIGTHVDTSSDAPFLDCAYKLQEYAGIARRKRSEGKATWPGRKQVFRHYRADGMASHDVVSLRNDQQAGTPLLVPVMLNGKRVSPRTALEEVRVHTRHQVTLLPDDLRSLEQAKLPYRVEIAPALHRLAAQLDSEIH